jgi:predicted Zn-dependent protease
MLAFAACHRNAITGRNQLSLVKEPDIQALSLTQYQQFLQTNKVVASSNSNSLMVKRISDRLISAITKYYDSKGLSQELANYKWEVNLIEDKTPNAWCMPGGKIVVYTGILPYTQNENALAIVMGHEIAHALARHGNERMTQGLIQQWGGLGLEVALANKPQETQQLYSQAYGVGSNIGAILPFGRKQELEADKFGLMYAALAGYDPRESVNFWGRMGQAGGGQKPPEFLSTHPSDERRIAALNDMMSDILRDYYKPR